MRNRGLSSPTFTFSWGFVSSSLKAVFIWVVSR
jgi:hypothetical protein